MPKADKSEPERRTNHIVEFEWLEGDEYWLNEDLLRIHVYEMMPVVHRPRPPPRPFEEREVARIEATYRRARSQKAKELTLARRALPLHQRLWLQALEANSFHEGIAHGAIRRQGFHFSESQCRSWKGHVRFKKALELSMSLAADDINKDKILLQTQKVVDIALTPRPILYQGWETGHEEYDPQSALTGLKMLGQNKKLWDADNAGRTILEIELIDFASDREPITIDNKTGVVDDAG